MYIVNYSLLQDHYNEEYGPFETFEEAKKWMKSDVQKSIEYLINTEHIKNPNVTYSDNGNSVLIKDFYSYNIEQRPNKKEFVYIVYDELHNYMMQVFRTKESALNYINKCYSEKEKISNRKLKRIEESTVAGVDVVFVYGITNYFEETIDLDYKIIKKEVM